MKLLSLLILLPLLQVSATGFSQKTKISIDMKSADLQEVLEEIERQSEYRFIYKDDLIDESVQYNLDMSKKTIDEVLNGLFQNSKLTYRMLEDNLVVLAQKNLFTQEIAVKGKVTDLEGMPLPGVNIVEKGSTNGTVTNLDGEYTISVSSPESILSFSYVGYLTEDVDISGKTVVDVTLVEDIQALEEVVVVGYGTMKKVNLTGAVTSVNMEELENRPITNATQALQGVSGLYVNQPGGQPGKDEATLRIRGQGTLNNNNPLVLVDGIEYSLTDVNPNDIESISVLKDAASAAIYGNRAANGVVLITTKKGTQGVTKIDYNNYFGMQSVTYLPDFIKDPVEFMELRNQAQLNSGRVLVDYSDEMIEEYRQGRLTNPYTYPSNDWLDIMFDNAFMQEHNLRISSGKDKMNYTLSLGYLDQEGVMKGTNSNKFTVRSNVNYQISDKIKVGSDFALTHRFIHEPATTAGTMMEMIFKAQGFHPTYLEDGRYANTWVRTPGHNVYRHPLVWANEGFLNNKTLRGLASIYTEIKLPFGITYYAKAAANKYEGFQKQFVPDIYMYNNKTLAESRVDYYTSNKNRHVTDQYDDDLNITLYHTLKWENSFNDVHNISVLVGNSYEKFSSRYLQATIEGFLGNNLQEIDAGSTSQVTNGSSSENYLIGAFGRVNYDYNQKYLFEANFRYDGSSKFAEGNRWGFFPSFSAGWRLEQEAFMQNIDWLSMFKLRASYGSLGNERIGNFKYINMMTIGTEYSFGGNVNPGVAVTAYNDPKITWETTTISNFGLDLSFLDYKLNASIEVYDKRTDNILRQVNIPAQVGNLDGPVMNIGEVSNKGVEINVGYQNLIGDFSYRFNAGLNYNVNEVVNLDDQVIYSGKYITQEGYPIDSYYLIEAEGIFQTQDEIDNSPFQNITTKPGYLKYKDQNGDDVINSDDRVILGSAIPKYTYNFNIDLNYKNWGLTAYFQGVEKVYTYPEKIGAVPFWFGTSVTTEWVNNSWTPERTDADLPIMTTFEDSQNDNFRASNFWLQDASYLRLKNIQLSYTIPQKLVSKMGIDNLRLFVNGQNILTFSEMKDFDPERHIKQSNYYEYPSVKTYSAGLNVTF